MTSYAPQYPSPLQISSSSPSSPLSPLSQFSEFSPTTPTPLLSSTFAQYSPFLPTAASTPPPPPQLPPLWTWSCHQCQTSYPLGATRRCLHDGHYFCSGTTINKDTGRVKWHKPCGSVFDYVGWRAWGEWRRAVKESQSKRPQSLLFGSMKKEHNCADDCDFPSECRWAARLSPGTKASKTGIISPVIGESEEGVLDAMDVDTLTEMEEEMDKEPPSPKSPLSPGFSQGDRSPISPTSPSESGSLLEKLIQSTEKRKSRDLALASLVPEAKASQQPQQQRQVGLTFPVLEFKNFKAGMDTVHGVFVRVASAGKDTTAIDAIEKPLFDEDAEMMDIDSLVPPSTIGMGVGMWRGFTSAPMTAGEPMCGVVGGQKEGVVEKAWEEERRQT
ncbi:hypothetical protein MMC30_009385 [Trapelia coarctata]|nr:hypothetical protein [Trapelia coarctata]